MHLWYKVDFKTDAERAHMIDITDLWITIVSGILVMTIRHVFIKAFYPVFYYYCKEQNIEDLRKKRAEKASECAFKFVYFLSTTIYGYYVLKDIDWFNKSLGGNGQMIAAFTDMP